LFVIQLLGTLDQEGLLVFDPALSGWTFGKSVIGPDARG
jgi:hypothetical protein